MPAILTAAASLNHSVTDSFTAREALKNESASEALIKFKARIDFDIVRLESQPTTHFRSLADFLRSYRDGNTNKPPMPSREVSNFNAKFTSAVSTTASTYGSNSLPSMGGGF